MRSMFEFWFTVLNSFWLVALALLTYVSLVDLIKLKLKGGFLLTIGFWFFFIFNLSSSLEFFPFTVSFVLGGLAVIIMLISLYVVYREYDRASSIYQLLRKLPLKDRVLRRIPESLLKEPLPPPISPPISFKLAVALILILLAAIGSIIYGYTLSIEASWTFPIDIPGYGTVDVPLPPAIHARNWYPIFSSVEYSCLSQQFLLLKTSKNRRNNRIDFFSSNYFRRTSNRHSFSKFRRPHHQFAFDVSPEQ